MLQNKEINYVFNRKSFIVYFFLSRSKKFKRIFINFLFYLEMTTNLTCNLCNQGPRGPKGCKGLNIIPNAYQFINGTTPIPVVPLNTQVLSPYILSWNLPQGMNDYVYTSLNETGKKISMKTSGKYCISVTIPYNFTLTAGICSIYLIIRINGANDQVTIKQIEALDINLVDDVIYKNHYIQLKKGDSIEIGLIAASDDPLVLPQITGSTNIQAVVFPGKTITPTVIKPTLIIEKCATSGCSENC